MQRRWHNGVFRTVFTIHFANNIVLIAMALMYAPHDFEIIIEYIWLGFMLVYLIFYPLQRCLVLYKFADIGNARSYCRHARNEYHSDH